MKIDFTKEELKQAYDVLVDISEKVNKGQILASGKYEYSNPEGFIELVSARLSHNPTREDEIMMFLLQESRIIEDGDTEYRYGMKIIPPREYMLDQILANNKGTERDHHLTIIGMDASFEEIERNPNPKHQTNYCSTTFLPDIWEFGMWYRDRDEHYMTRSNDPIAEYAREYNAKILDDIYQKSSKYAIQDRPIMDAEYDDFNKAVEKLNGMFARMPAKQVIGEVFEAMKNPSKEDKAMFLILKAGKTYKRGDEFIFIPNDKGSIAFIDYSQKIIDMSYKIISLETDQIRMSESYRDKARPGDIDITDVRDISSERLTELGLKEDKAEDRSMTTEMLNYDELAAKAMQEADISDPEGIEDPDHMHEI